jgi:hypothetical protein
MSAPDELRALARKYSVMRALRDAGAPDERAEDRRALRALAAEFPGALRELDTLPTDEIDHRRGALEAAAAGGPRAPWMDWLAAYHAEMRLALALKRRLAGGRALDAAALAEAAAESGLPVDDAHALAVAAPPHGRLNVVVFARLAARFGAPAKTIWDALFPPRKGDRPYRAH